MTDAGELRRLFDEVADLPARARSAAIEALEVDDSVRSRLRSMLAVEAEIESTGDVEPQPRTHPWPGDSVGSYRLVAPIGDGGMGSVWLAVSRGAPEIDVAIKLAIPMTVSDAEARARLNLERRVLAALDHPGIVPIVDAGTTANGVPFLALRAIHGRTIDTYARERALDPTSIVEVFEHVAEALEHAHERGIVHRDIKPHNLLVAENGTPVIIDFGAARITEASDLAPSHLTVGASPRTPAYSSPEQKRGEDATPSADVYALGVTLRTVLEIRGGAGKIDRRLASILDRACHKKIHRRYSSARELHAALGSWRRGVELRSVRRRSRFRASVVTVLVLITLGRMDNGDRQVVDARSAALRSALLEGIAGMPAAEIPADYKTLADLAERQGSVDWAIAALVLAVQSGEYELARGAIGETLGRLGGASPLRRVEFAHVCSDLGLPGPTVAALRQVNVELLDPVERLELMVLGLTNRMRAGQPPTDENLQVLAKTLERLGATEPPTLAMSQLQGLRLALGEESAIARWLANVSDAAWSDPREARTAEIEALLGLHLRLRAAGHVSALADSYLAAIESDLERRGEEDDAVPVVRAWGAARMTRVLEALRSDPRRARDLAQAGVVRLTESGTAPLDLLVRVGALNAFATSRTGGIELARRSFRETAKAANGVLGSASPITRGLEEAARDPSAAEPFRERSISADVSWIRGAVEKEARLRPGRPWWAPG